MAKRRSLSELMSLITIFLVLAALILAPVSVTAYAAANGKPNKADKVTIECKDRIDNDGDGLIDLDDPDCRCEDDCSTCQFIPGSYCGDGTCDDLETCENCEQDCGECPLINET